MRHTPVRNYARGPKSVKTALATAATIHRGFCCEAADKIGVVATVVVVGSSHRVKHSSNLPRIEAATREIHLNTLVERSIEMQHTASTKRTAGLRAGKDTQTYARTFIGVENATVFLRIHVF